MLTQTLRDMEADGLVTRRVYGTVPPAVDYTLSPLGKRFVEPLELLYGWGRANSDALDQLAFNRGMERPPRESSTRDTSP
ncbi:putative HTH-type transcriptional regulator YybR [compost metagenome]